MRIYSERLCAYRRSLIGCVCRQQRLDEMKEASARPHFTSMTMIRASDFKHHVTDASLSAWVVVLLFKDECAIALAPLQNCSLPATFRIACAVRC